MNLNLSQKLSLTQRLTPQQILYQKILQLNVLSLEQKIKNEIELNPFLEEDISIEEAATDEAENPAEDINDEDNDEFSSKDLLDDDDYYQDDPEYLNRRGSDDEPSNIQTPQRETMSEHLIEQLHMLDIDENLMVLGEEIIGSLDDDGYLKEELSVIIKELRLFQHIDIPEETAEQLLKRIQLFDPLGIACRSLQECLLVQLHNLALDPYYSFLAEKVLTEHFEDFTHKRYKLLKKNLKLTDETLHAVLDLIHKLNPRPGEGKVETKEFNQITPDFIVEREGKSFTIALNDRSVPSVTISPAYVQMLQENKKSSRKSEVKRNTYAFLKERFESAKWFLACIEQRKNTLMRVMQSIVTKQFDFFDKGPKHLRPLIYRDLAEEINLDVSTISRVVNGKYVQSPQGIHELKYFFSESLTTESGEEISNKVIKERIKEIIAGESKSNPLSDDKLAEILNKEGINIARRTIAKYREQERIPVARLRREL